MVGLRVQRTWVFPVRHTALLGLVIEREANHQNGDEIPGGGRLSLEVILSCSSECQRALVKPSARVDLVSGN